MTKLQCSAVHCEYNSNNRCCRPEIKVGGGREAKSSQQTCCDSFREKTGTMKNSASYCHPDNSLTVACTAMCCDYNQNGMCAAQAIKIGDVSACRSGETECHTFTCK